MNNTLTQAFLSRFLTNTDATGRFIVTSKRTGKIYCVEPQGDPHIDWGSVIPGQKTLAVKKGWDKHKGSTEVHESMITEGNGFKRIVTLNPGESPHAYIEFMDKEYPDKE